MFDSNDRSPASSALPSQVSQSSQPTHRNDASQPDLPGSAYTFGPSNLLRRPLALDLRASGVAQLLNDIAAQEAARYITTMRNCGWTADDIRHSMDAPLAHAIYLLHDLYTFESVVADAYFGAGMRNAIIHMLQQHEIQC